MSSFVPLVPLPNRGSASSHSRLHVRASIQCARALDAARAGMAGIRRCLRILRLHAMTQTSVAGCSVGSNEGCDVVLSSSWSKWLGIPVAVLGTGCYATLATLSVLLGCGIAAANRWISTAFVMLSIAAAGASLWFIGVQIFAIRQLLPVLPRDRHVRNCARRNRADVRGTFGLRSVERIIRGQSGLHAALRTTMPVGSSHRRGSGYPSTRSSVAGTGHRRRGSADWLADWRAALFAAQDVRRAEGCAHDTIDSRWSPSGKPMATSSRRTERSSDAYPMRRRKAM